MISFSFAPATTRIADVGGKGASLFRLVALGCPVPPFFVLTADARRTDRLDEASRAAVLDAWRKLGGEAHAFAVRSSAIAEDSQDSSFAGVFETILKVHGEEAMIAAVEKCLASHKSAAADTYRSDRAMQRDDGMAVVVQRMVDATWAGVSFTADPTSQALSVVTINAVKGLGEDLVSGLANPEEIAADRRTGNVISRHALAGQEPFPDRLLKQVVSESIRVADAFGFPQDLEWAFDGDALQLLQSRPITTITGVCLNRPLEPWADNPAADADSADRLWTRAYADEIWAPPVSPLFYDIQNLTGQIPMQLAMYGDPSGGPPDAFKYFRAAPYLDTKLLERLYVFQPRMMRLPAILTQLHPDRREAIATAPWKWWGVLNRAWDFEVRHGPRRGFFRNHKFLKSAWAPFLAASDPLLAVDEAALDDTALDKHLISIWTVAGSIGLECGITVFHYAQDLKLLTTALLSRWLGRGEDLYALVTAGLEDSHTVAEADGIWQIAALIRNAGPGVAAQASATTWHTFSQFTLPELGPIREAFRTFLAAHAHRGANYKDPIHPRWGDDPELLWSQVQAFLEGEHVRPREANARSAAARIAQQEDCIASLRGVLAPLKRRILKFLFRYNQIYMSLRDNHRFYYDRIWWALRRIYVEKGKRLHRAGKLAEADDVFFLVRKEIADLASGALPVETAAERIALRRKEWLQTRAVQPPKFLRNGYVPEEEPASSLATARRLVGLPASAGQVTGLARIVYDVSELGRVGENDILVTRQTDPSWTPAFARLRGLVLETGGVLAHGASLCREFNVPCVTTVERATQIIRDGDLIALNGGLGTVEILEPAPAYP